MVGSFRHRFNPINVFISTEILKYRKDKCKLFDPIQEMHWYLISKYFRGFQILILRDEEL